LILAFSIATLLSVVASRLLARRITRRLDGLADAAAALASGDGSARAPVDGDDEVTGVSHSFNAMANQLEDLATREREFLMSVGHDLRTPLTTIAGYAEVLEDGDLDSSETDRIAGVLATETSRLRRLVEDLMLLAGLEAREFTLEMESVDVSAHVREVVAGFEPRAEEARVALLTEIESTGFTNTDVDRIAQILGNLVENALRYSPEAGSVTVGVRRTGAEVEISVADTGSGIDPNDLDRVFEKFYVARHYRRVRPEGSGLGLSIVKQLVDALGGRAVVTSDVSKGTTVWVRLPSPEKVLPDLSGESGEAR
jgi:two-component system sensor histidine kinase BaeS